MNHEEVFFNFVIQHDALSHIVFGQKPAGQKIIAVVGDAEVDNTVGTVIIDPNWDLVYESFINLDHNLESIEYMKTLLEPYTNTQTQAYIDGLVKKMIERGIVADKIYVRVPSTADKSFYDEVIEV